MSTKRAPVDDDGSSWLDRPGLSLGRVVVAHSDGAGAARVGARPAGALSRRAREEILAATLSPGATLPSGAGNRAAPEDADPERTCFERDRDRILHSNPLRRLAGKTQVVCSPPDHVRTRLTHSLEVAQIGRGIASGLGLNCDLVEAIALAHDCGHTPLGHAGESAMRAFDPGFDHAVFGADVMLAGLNLTMETLDGVRNHSWSRPSPATPEGCVVSLADRIAYCCHDLADAERLGLVAARDLPEEVAAVVGADQRSQIAAFVSGAIAAGRETGLVGLPLRLAEALDGLRAFNYERIYSSETSLRQREAVIPMLRALVELFAAEPGRVGLPGEPPGPGSGEALRRAVHWVVGMTDRYASDAAVALLGWDEAKLPQSV